MRDACLFSPRKDLTNTADSPRDWRRDRLRADPLSQRRDDDAPVTTEQRTRGGYNALPVGPED